MAQGFKTGGRAKGSKNKATVERELNAASVIERARKEGRELGVDVLERMMHELVRFKELAEGAAAVHRPPTTPDQLAQLATAQSAENDLANKEKRNARVVYAGDWEQFGKWYDRVVGTTHDAAYCAKEIAKYQTPQIKAVEVPAPAPDPEQIERDSRMRFGLRVFDGGKPLKPAVVV